MIRVLDNSRILLVLVNPFRVGDGGPWGFVVTRLSGGWEVRVPGVILHCYRRKT